MTKRNRLILLALPTLIAIAVLVVILNWHVSSRVRITATINRMVFKVAGQDKARILDSIALKSLVVERFETIKFKPEVLSLISDGTSSGTSQVAAPSKGPVTPQPIVITPRSGRTQSNVTLKPPADGSQTMPVIDALNAQPSSEIFIEDTEDLSDLILRIYGQRSSGSIGIANTFSLIADESDIAGIQNRVDLAGPITLNAKLIRDSSVEFVSQSDALIMTLTLPTENSTALLPQGHVPISAIKFESQDETGKVLTSLTRDTSSEVSYADYAGMGNVTVTWPNFLWLDDLQNFSVEEMTYTPGKRGIVIRLVGVAGKISSGSPDDPIDHRLTLYDALWNDHKVVAIFAALCWVAGTTAAFYKFFKEA